MPHVLNFDLPTIYFFYIGQALGGQYSNNRYKVGEAEEEAEGGEDLEISLRSR